MRAHTEDLLSHEIYLHEQPPVSMARSSGNKLGTLVQRNDAIYAVEIAL